MVGGTTAHAAKIVEALLRSMPPEHQVVADQALAQAGESMETVARELSGRFHDGVGFLVARLPEAAAIESENDEPGAVHPIPATVVVFRLRDPALGGDQVIAALRRRAKLLFDAEFTTSEERLPAGARLFVLERHGLGGQWELLRPAFAIDGDRFLFATHAEHLRRAVSAHHRRPPQPLPTARTLVASLRSEPLRSFIDDQRFEVADRETFHDWADERRGVEALRTAAEDAATRADGIDAEMRARIARRRTEEIPAAADAYRERWRWLRLLGDADARAELRGGTLEVRGRIALRR